MMGFNKKTKKLEVRLINKTLMQRELQRMTQTMLDQANFLMIPIQSRMEQEQKDMETLLGTFTESIGDKQDQNFSKGDNVVPKKKMKRRKGYSNTKVKTRNLLTNVLYRRFKEPDFNKNSFIIDILSFFISEFQSNKFGKKT